VKDRTFEEVARNIRNGVDVTEFDIQRRMAGFFQEEGLVSDSDPVVAAQEHAGDPHYLPAAGKSRRIGADELVLLDLWAKKAGNADAVYADITWVGFTGSQVPQEMARVFATVAAARDAAAELARQSARAHQDLRGWQVDRAARKVLEDAGYGERILHRTGHNLGREVHGNGVHMDDYESHDDRRLLAGTGFTIEPGLYFASFGVRSEINVFYGEHDALITGPVQTEILRLV